MIRAISYNDKHQHRADRAPGSLHITMAGSNGISMLWFYCPCGCGALGKITVGDNFKPVNCGASWRWNGNRENASLEPSVNQRVCGWHGWLRDGYWEAV